MASKLMFYIFERNKLNYLNKMTKYEPRTRIKDHFDGSFYQFDQL